MDHIPAAGRTGFLRNQRVVLNHFDVSTQANLHPSDATGARDKRDAHAHYDRQDIREQYCITERGLGALDADDRRPRRPSTTAALFGCLSARRGPPCPGARPSLLMLTACVGRRGKLPSDEGAYEAGGGGRGGGEGAPYPRKDRYPWGPVITDIYHYDEDLQSSYFRRKVGTDPSRYTWMPADDESVRMEKPTSLMDRDHSQEQLLNPPALLAGKKHVSFARSYTMASFDDARSTMSRSTSQLNTLTKSQERLLDVRKMEIQPITKQPEPDISSDKIRKTPMKTQATQTEVNLGRRTPPSYVNLSPRTMQKVKMVSQGAQTNGQNGRKLTKSCSEAGDTFGLPFLNGHDNHPCDAIFDHEPLHRTQSDEPPRSPFVLDPSPPPLPPSMLCQQRTVESEAALARSDLDSEDSTEVKNEIFIDFKPQSSEEPNKVMKRCLIKALSDGEILLEQRRAIMEDDRTVPNKSIYSLSHENVQTEENPKSFSPYFQQSPILNEGICKPLEENVYSSRDTGLYGQDSIEEDFHEHLIYNRRFLSAQHSLEGASIGMENWLRDECVVPSISFTSEKRMSPFTSSDSLANDNRDQSSDGIWNESQVTVLQADPAIDLTSDPTSATLALTPSSRRKHLLMLQHQQRSSFDSDALLDEEVAVLQPQQQQQETAPRQFLSVVQLAGRGGSRRRQQESPLPVAVVPELVLARTDSARTNTDVSESTTTEDYVTANSGTDSSRSKGLEMFPTTPNNPPPNNEGSSFESSRDLFADDMVVPSPTPRSPHAHAHTPPAHTGRSTPSDDTSSSCGSYSVGGAATPDLLEAVAGRVEGVSGDERRSVRYSSSGYYESPVEDDFSSTWTSPRYENKKSTDPKSYLEINHVPGTKPSKRNTKISPSSEKPKRTRSRMQNNKKSHQLKKSSVVYLDGKESKPTSDESSCDIGMNHVTNSSSPKKSRKVRDGDKRRSPVGTDKKHSGLSGSLAKRKTPKIASIASSPDLNSAGKKISNGDSPSESNRHCHQDNEDSCKLKAVSAESLRSVSPGSDSVFYSDPSSHLADHHVHCLQCGKEVDIFTTKDSDKPTTCGEIFQPPAGFQDSPRVKPPERLYKKFDRRLRSEERTLMENKKNRHGTEVRAKSEERATKSYNRNKLRPMAKSTNNSQEQLKATDSSPCVLPDQSENEDNACIYDVPYMDGCWVHIDEREEVNSCRNPCPIPNEIPKRTRSDSVSSTESERDFRKRYQTVSHRLIHRKSCMEMYNKQNNNTFFGPMSKWICKEKNGPYYISIHED